MTGFYMKCNTGLEWVKALSIKNQFSLDIETSNLICYANQLTGFYMKETLLINGLTIRTLHHDTE